MNITPATHIAHTSVADSEDRPAPILANAGELVVYCPAPPTDDGLGRVYWQSVSSTNDPVDASGVWHSNACAELIEKIETGHSAFDGNAKAQPITLILPCHSLLSGSLTLDKAQRRHLHKTLPYLIEEQLCDDVEQMHIAYHHTVKDGELQVYYHAINKQRLNELVTEFNGPKHKLKAIYTETQWLLAQQTSEQPNEYHQLWFVDQQWLLSQSTSSLHSAQSSRLLRDALPTALQILAAANNKHNTEQNILCQAPVEQLTEGERSVLSTYPNTKLIDSASTCMPVSSVSLHALQQLEKQTDNNLLQGHYRPKNSATNKETFWPALVASIGILFVLQCGYWLASGWYFKQQQQQLAEETEMLYREYFPQDKRIINVRRQTQSHLRKSSQSDSDFLSLLTHFTGAWHEQRSNLNLTQLRYQQSRDPLLITLEADSIASLDQLTRKLSHSGLQANLLSAKEIEENGEQQSSTTAKFQASISLSSGQHLSQR